VRHWLKIDMENQAAWHNDEVSLKQWRKRIEESGIFIFKDTFKQKEISGFCLRDENLPIIYLNNSTTKTRQIFSLLHELAHLLMNINGLSKFDTDYIERLSYKEKKIEQFCNAIAAEILIPSSDFTEQIKHFPFSVDNLSDEKFSELANRYGVSREAVLRRFLDQGRISKTVYQKKAEFWTGQRKKPTGRGNYYATQNVYLSNRFASEVIGKYYRRQITMNQAADMLGVKTKNFHGLEQKILQGANA
jgi:Zn-dependent peptidase ImmA (M78 family)